MGDAINISGVKDEILLLLIGVVVATLALAASIDQDEKSLSTDVAGVPARVARSAEPGNRKNKGKKQLKNKGKKSFKKKGIKKAKKSLKKKGKKNRKNKGKKKSLKKRGKKNRKNKGKKKSRKNKENKKSRKNKKKKKSRKNKGKKRNRNRKNGRGIDGTCIETAVTAEAEEPAEEGDDEV